ncbi:MAG: hypothetical protein IEMM0002_0768 [bacterium]|nr:MAG: hypothetical protein IEMM0002_0768 [bacterium]
MKIDKVINECLIALFNNSLISNTLILKGGTALNVSENIKKRLSTDIDFSVSGQIVSPEVFFKELKKSLFDHFIKQDWEIFDFEKIKKPKNKHESKPPTWGGWLVHFKIIGVNHNFSDIAKKRRNALIPQGHISSKIKLEISEHEFCELIKEIRIDGVLIKVYHPVLLVLEKLRAICQQHPSCPHHSAKNRARDYYDIYELLKKHRSASFFKSLRDYIEPVFKAKDVDLEIILKIFGDDFVEFQRNGFEAVIKSLSESPGKIEDFSFYNEQLKFLIMELGVKTNF